MLPVLLLYAADAAPRRLRSAKVAVLRQTPRQFLVAVVVILAVAIDFAIPLLTLGCLSIGGCPVLHP